MFLRNMHEDRAAENPVELASPLFAQGFIQRQATVGDASGQFRIVLDRQLNQAGRGFQSFNGLTGSHQPRHVDAASNPDLQDPRTVSEVVLEPLDGDTLAGSVSLGKGFTVGVVGGNGCFVHEDKGPVS